jgi:hypothetical protein
MRFATQDYFNKDAAKKAARSFQIAFATMRTKQRQRAFKAAKIFENVQEETFQGPYDHLGAYLREQEDYWEVRILPETADPVTVVDALTGQPVEKLTPEYRRWKALAEGLVDAMFAAQKAKQTFTNPLSAEDTSFMWSYKPEETKVIWTDMGLEEPQDASLV